MRIYLIASVCLLLIAGCASASTEHALGDGFFIKATPNLFESGGGQQLYYRPPKGRQKRVWKFVPDAVVVKQGIAAFVGDYKEAGRTGASYFAVRNDGPVIRVGRAILS